MNAYSWNAQCSWHPTIPLPMLSTMSESHNEIDSEDDDGQHPSDEGIDAHFDSDSAPNDTEYPNHMDVVLDVIAALAHKCGDP